MKTHTSILAFVAFAAASATALVPTTVLAWGHRGAAGPHPAAFRYHGGMPSHGTVLPRPVWHAASRPVYFPHPVRYPAQVAWPLPVLPARPYPPSYQPVYVP